MSHAMTVETVIIEACKLPIGRNEWQVVEAEQAIASHAKPYAEEELQEMGNAIVELCDEFIGLNFAFRVLIAHQHFDSLDACAAADASRGLIVRDSKSYEILMAGLGFDSGRYTFRVPGTRYQGGGSIIDLTDSTSSGPSGFRWACGPIEQGENPEEGAGELVVA